ncbi:MAG: DUF1449 family protein [Trueperaceae bacterium]|nr:DUF1449 family protein [Trueperaceae bacterium]
MAWLEWWNFMFLLPLVAGLLIGIALVATGALAEVSAELDAGDLSDGGELEPGDAEGETGESAVAQVLSFFGLGQGIPLSVMLPLLFMTGGLSGLVLNMLISKLFPVPVVFATVSLFGSFFLSAFIGQGLASVLRGLFKARVTAIDSAGLIGLEGQAVYAISNIQGVAHVKDPFGNIHRISCRSALPIEAGMPVQVKDYDSKTGAYLVELRLEKGN